MYPKIEIILTFHSKLNELSNIHKLLGKEILQKKFCFYG